MALYRCDECSSDFEWNFQLGRHAKRKHATPPPPPVASSSSSSDSVKEPEEQDVVCRLGLFCSDDKLNANSVRKRSSVRIDRNETTELKCDHCKYSTKSSLFLVRHHSTCLRKTSPCALCLTPSTFMMVEEDADILMDLCEQTLEVEIYVCTDCPFRTPVKDDFVIHQFIHKGLAQLQANCTLPGDVTSMQNDKFECRYCGRMFRRKEHMRRHIGSQHTATEDIVWHSCEQCPAEYKRKEHLTRHVATSHAAPEDVVWFSCEVCPQRFKRKEHLKRHMMRATHTDVNRNRGSEPTGGDQSTIGLYQCGVCTAAFKTNRGLQRHHGYSHSKLDGS